MLLAAALAVTVVAAAVWAVAGPGPTPVPLPSATQSVVPSPSTASPPPSPLATSSVRPSGSPDAGAGIFRLNLIGGPLSNALPVLVIDGSGTVKGLAEGSGLGTVDAPVSVTAGPDPSAVVVRWTGGVCDVGETFDGGATWVISPVTWGTVVGLGLDGNQDPWAAVACGEVPDGCVPGVYRRTGTGWTRGLALDPVRLAVSGEAVAVLEHLPMDPLASYAFPPRGLRLTRDGGASWTILKDPCPATTSYATAVALDGEARLVVVCEGQGATGSSKKTIWRSVGDVPGHWEKLADGPEPGTGMAMSLAADGTGVMWGPRLLQTKDGGATWVTNAFADSTTRVVVGGSALPQEHAVILVSDPEAAATLLLGTRDGGFTWTEMHAFPVPQT